MLATWKSRIIPARSRVFTITLKLRDVTLVDRDPRSLDRERRFNLTFGHAVHFVELGHLPSPFSETYSQGV